MKNNNPILIILSVAVVIILIVALVISLKKLHNAETEKDEIVEQMGYEREQLEANKRQLEGDYLSFSEELRGFSIKVDNDSILKKLNEEQKRVQLLMEELRTTKATNHRRINELKNELVSVRKVLVHYIAQVDSLNVLNTQLNRENREVSQKYRQASETVVQLSQEKEQLTEQVVRAAQLEARNISVEQQTESGKKTSRINKTALLKFSFVISKNITAKTGEKTIYIRIETPDKEILFKKASDTFRFEDKEIVYSARKSFEYSGEETAQTVYWTVEETLWKGAYRADIFIDGHLIGSKDFELIK
jgi:uncharacterized protein YeeX (DUF496 family)